MADPGRDLTAELRVLAELLIDKVEPILRRVDLEDAPEWDGCSWCPFCAVAAVLRGERHDLVTLVSSELDGVLEALRDALQTHGRAHPEPPTAERSEATEPSAGTAVPPPSEPPTGRAPTYQPIRVTVAREDRTES